MKFNKKKCLKLFHEENKLRKEGKSLRNLNKYKHLKLIVYLILLEDNIFWQDCKEYYSILESFSNNSTNINQFLKQFSDLLGSHRKASILLEKNLTHQASETSNNSNQIDLQINPESRGFSKIISSLSDEIYLYDSDVSFDMNLNHPELIGYGLSEEFLRIRIKNTYLPQIYKYCSQKE